jgi:putative membrane protein
MSRPIHYLMVGGGAAALFLAGPIGAQASVAASGDAPVVVNRETVQAELHPDGSLDVARLFSQLTIVGKGVVSLTDPTSGKGLRNLDGFSSPTVRDGNALYTIDVDGTASRRTVSDFGKALPVTVRADYVLDGKTVKAKDLVGESGTLTTRYTVTNVSGTPTKIVWKDGKGAPQSRTVDLVTPYVGQLMTTLPSSFTSIDAPRADAAADGHGGTAMAWTMVLFGPIGDATQTFGYTADITDGVLPPATVQIVPVPPNKKPELQFGQAGFKQGAEQASQLTVGAGQIDANLLKLQSGAGDLLDGLTKLSAGAAQLSSGLKGQIGPGATKLAAGTTAAEAGGSALASGLGTLSTGAGSLSEGLGSAAAGSGDLADGLVAADDGAAALSAGIDQLLAGVQALPTTLQQDAGYQQLQGALTAVKAGIGSATDVSPTTLLGGMNLLKYGLRSPLGVGGCNQTAAPGTATACGAADAVQLVQDRLASAAATGGSLDQLIGAAKAGYAASLCPAVPSGVLVPVAGVLPPTTLGLPLPCVYLSNLAYGLGLPAGIDPGNLLGGVKAQTSLAAGTLSAVFQGIDASILPGIDKVKLALSNPACDLTDPQSTTNPCGIAQVQSLIGQGIATLVTQVSAQLSGFLSDASDGAAALADGTAALADGGAQLDEGVQQLAAGAAKLADGAGDAATGAHKLVVGLGELDTGAGQLAAGITKAAGGAAQIADGLKAAKAGESKVVSGAGELRDKGTSKLVSSGNETASVNAERYATLVALGAKAKDGALPYGAPAGATGSAAYQLTLAAATSEAHDNTLRALAAAGVLGLACGLGALRRRRSVL